MKNFYPAGTAYIQDHVCMVIKIPLKYSLSQVIGNLKSKSAMVCRCVIAVQQRILAVKGLGLEVMRFQPVD